MESVGRLRYCRCGNVGILGKRPAVTASDAAVKVTAYRKTGKVLLSIGNYSDEVKNVRLSFDWKQLGLEGGKVQLTAPYVEDFQPATQWGADGEIAVQPRKMADLCTGKEIRTR